MSQRQYIFSNGSRCLYTLRRSKKAKNILLHVNVDGSVELVVPWRASYAYAERFVREKEAWLVRALAKNSTLRQRIPERPLKTGTKIPYFDTEYCLDVRLNANRRRAYAKEDGQTLLLQAQSEQQVRASVMRWYRTKSRDYFVGQSIRFADQLGVRVANVRVLDTKSQWGSCNKAKGTLTFSWRLALAPERIARYVVAHEVAHLKRGDHSPAFWRHVATLDGDHKKSRKWLRQNGYTLVL